MLESPVPWIVVALPDNSRQTIRHTQCRQRLGVAEGPFLTLKRVRILCTTVFELYIILFPAGLPLSTMPPKTARTTRSQAKAALDDGVKPPDKQQKPTREAPKSMSTSLEPSEQVPLSENSPKKRIARPSGQSKDRIKLPTKRPERTQDAPGSLAASPQPTQDAPLPDKSPNKRVTRSSGPLQHEELPVKRPKRTHDTTESLTSPEFSHQAQTASLRTTATKEARPPVSEKSEKASRQHDVLHDATPITTRQSQNFQPGFVHRLDDQIANSASSNP